MNKGSLMSHRQKSRREIAPLIVREPFGVWQHHEARKVVGLAAQGIADPGPKGGESGQQRPGVHEVTGRSVDIGPRLHGHQEGDVIHASGQVRH